MIAPIDDIQEKIERARVKLVEYENRLINSLDDVSIEENARHVQVWAKHVYMLSNQLIVEMAAHNNCANY